jgi:antitoxin CptB
MYTDSTLDKQIYWRSRRGLLELDHVLQLYWQAHKATMDDTGKQQFTALLDCQDPELLQYLVYRSADADDVVMQALVSSIRHFIDQQHS